MTRSSRLWLAAAAAVAMVVTAVVLVFGYRPAPEFADLYSDGGPTLSGSVAYMEFGREDCVWVLDLASGDEEELFCDNYVWPESWDEDGNLRVRTGDGHEQIWVLDPATGDVLETTDPWEDLPHDEGGPPPHEEQPLRARSVDGRVTLTHGFGDEAVTLVDVEAPRDYSFNMYGVAADGEYAWICDSEDRLLVVALDGSSDPWVVADEIYDPVWN